MPPADPTPPAEPRPVWRYPNVAPISIAAFFNDTGGDMLYAFQTPFLLAVIGNDAWAQSKLGLVRSVAVVAGFLVLPLSGRLADRVSRKYLINEGYALIVLSRLVQGLAWVWWHLLPLAFLKELGRSMRNPAREALLADSVPREVRGRAFGLFQSMDTFGAILGPLVGLGIFMWLTSGGMEAVPAYKWIFVVAAIPTLVSIGIIARGAREIRGTAEDRPGEGSTPPPAKGRASLGGTWRLLRETPHLGPLTLISALCALWAVEESFLQWVGAVLLGIPIGEIWPIILLYWFINVTFAPAAWFSGRWSDRHHRKGPLVAGYLLLAALTLGFALLPAAAPCDDPPKFSLDLRVFAWMAFLFGLHGIYQGLISPSQKALVVELSPPEKRGEVLGAFGMCTGLAGVLGPLIFGLLWDLGKRYDLGGHALPFALAGGFIGLGAVLLALLVPTHATERRGLSPSA